MKKKRETWTVNKEEEKYILAYDNSKKRSEKSKMKRLSKIMIE